MACRHQIANRNSARSRKHMGAATPNHACTLATPCNVLLFSVLIMPVWGFLIGAFAIHLYVRSRVQHGAVTFRPVSVTGTVPRATTAPRTRMTAAGTFARRAHAVRLGSLTVACSLSVAGLPAQTNALTAAAAAAWDVAPPAPQRQVRRQRRPNHHQACCRQRHRPRAVQHLAQVRPQRSAPARPPRTCQWPVLVKPPREAP